MNTSDKHRKKNSFFIKPTPRWWAALLSLAVGAIMLLGITVGPGEFVAFIIATLTNPATWPAVSIMAAGGATVWYKLQEVKEKADKARERADVAALKATNTAQRTDNLESGVSALNLALAGMRALTDELQQEREGYRAQIIELRGQLRQLTGELEAARREITNLKTSLRELNRESVSDKQQITVLQARVASLEMEVAKLTLDNNRLAEENRFLKTSEIASNDAAAKEILDQLAELKKVANGEKQDQGQDQDDEEQKRIIKNSGESDAPKV